MHDVLMEYLVVHATWQIQMMNVVELFSNLS